MKKIFAVILLCFMLLPFCGGVGKRACAKSCELDFETFARNEYQNMIKEGDLLRFYDRTAGTDGEKLFAVYLEQKMISFGYEPNGTDTENKSFEKFAFTSLIDGQEKQSQNVKFVKKGAGSEKKVVFCTSYDNAFGFAQGQESYSVIGEDAGLSNVVTVLSVACALKDITFDYDIEFVFFGAEYHDFAGGKNYSLGIDEREAKNILVAFNIDDLSESTLFYYDAEVNTKYGVELENYSKSNFNIEILKYCAGNSVIFSESENYPFTHRALMSDNSALIHSGIRTISFLTASKTGVFGNEYYRNVSNVEFSGNSTPESITCAASKVAELISNFVCDVNLDEFASESITISKFITNKVYAVILFLTVIGIIWIVYFVVYGKFMKNLKSKYSSSAAAQTIGDMLEKEIDKSNDPEVKLMRNQIKEVFMKKIKEKIDEDN